jgi:hypothetical protein
MFDEFNYFLKGFENRDRISLEVTTDTFKPVKFIAIYGCFNKATLRGKVLS